MILLTLSLNRKSLSSLPANSLKGQQRPCLTFSDVLAWKGSLSVPFFFFFLTHLCSTEHLLLEDPILSFSDLKILSITKSVAVSILIFQILCSSFFQFFKVLFSSWPLLWKHKGIFRTCTCSGREETTSSLPYFLNYFFLEGGGDETSNYYMNWTLHKDTGCYHYFCYRWSWTVEPGSGQIVESLGVFFHYDPVWTGIRLILMTQFFGVCFFNSWFVWEQYSRKEFSKQIIRKETTCFKKSRKLIGKFSRERFLLCNTWWWKHEALQL